MLRRIGLTTAWVVTTLVAVFIAGQAVGGVGEQVTDRAASLPDIVSTLGPEAVTAPDSATATTAATVIAPPDDTVVATTGVPFPDVTSTTAPVVPVATTAPDPGEEPASTSSTTSSTTATTSTSSTTSSTTTTSTTTTTAVPFEQSQHALSGGVVVLKSRPGEVVLVTASPNPGYTVRVKKSGPDSVEVEFRGDNPQYEGELHAEWRDGELDVEIEESFGDD